MTIMDHMSRFMVIIRPTWDHDVRVCGDFHDHHRTVMDHHVKVHGNRAPWSIRSEYSIIMDQTMD